MEKHKWKINVINQKRFKNASKNIKNNYEILWIIQKIKFSYSIFTNSKNGALAENVIYWLNVNKLLYFIVINFIYCLNNLILAWLI